MTATLGQPLPEPQVAAWLNTNSPITLASLRGRVVMIETFQMLCPGCVLHGLPQAQRVSKAFPATDVVVIGLHTVFEHHAAMEQVSLQAFLHEYRIDFPVGIDQPDTGPIPRTMTDYGLRGTPSMLLVDRLGVLRAHHFGEVPDLVLGAEIAGLMATNADVPTPTQTTTEETGCDETGCIAGGQSSTRKPSRTRQQQGQMG